MTIFDIPVEQILAAFGFVVAIVIIIMVVVAFMVLDAILADRRGIALDLIPTDQNPDVYGDVPRLPERPVQAKYPRESARICDMPERVEM